MQRSVSQIETKIDAVYEATRMQRSLTDDEWKAFFVFAGSLSVRVPSFIDRFQEFASDVYGHAFELLKHSPRFVKHVEDLGVPPEVLARVEVEADRDVSLLMCLQAMDTPIQIFSKMTWQFIRAPGKNYFIAGDNPVVHCVPDRDPVSIFPPGLADKDVEVTIALSKTICAVGAFRPSKMLYRVVDDATVDLVNSRTAAFARRYLYSATKNPKAFHPSQPGPRQPQTAGD
jgi:Protein of unknown function (DUF4238)